MKHNYRKILSLLGIEITHKNDEQLLTELPWNVNDQEGFSDSFHNNLMQQLFETKESFETKIVQMFRRTALPAAAAILVLSVMNFSQIKNIENIFMADEIGEVGEWIEDSSEEWWNEL